MGKEEGKGDRKGEGGGIMLKHFVGEFWCRNGSAKSVVFGISNSASQAPSGFGKEKGKGDRKGEGGRGD